MLTKIDYAKFVLKKGYPMLSGSAHVKSYFQEIAYVNSSSPSFSMIVTFVTAFEMSSCHVTK
jgi:hypothetical protein